MNSIGEKIAELRKKKEMTQEELSSIIGVSAQSVSKWENSQTMPDIMLLPTLASALDVTVNDLFSIVSEEDHLVAVNPDMAAKKAYEALYTVLAQGLCSDVSVSKADISKHLDDMRKIEGVQSGLVSYENGEVNGGTYINPSIGLSYVKSKAEAISLLDCEIIAEPLMILADANVRSVLKYMLTNGNATVTAAVAANKSGVSLNEAEAALEKLASIKIIRIQSVVTEEERPLNVYHVFGEHKMYMAVFPILELAKTLSEWHEFWLGFRC